MLVYAKNPATISKTTVKRTLYCFTPSIKSLKDVLKLSIYPPFEKSVEAIDMIKSKKYVAIHNIQIFSILNKLIPAKTIDIVKEITPKAEIYFNGFLNTFSGAKIPFQLILFVIDKNKSDQADNHSDDLIPCQRLMVKEISDRIRSGV